MAAKHSVILSSYNRPTLIQKAIESVLSQTTQDFEAIIADDGSSAETLDVIRKLIHGDSRIQLLTTEGRTVKNHDHVVNRSIDRINEALSLSSGEILHYLCDDDLYDVQRFAAFDALFQDPNVIVGYGRLNYIDCHGAPTHETRYFEKVEDPFCKLDHNQFAHRRSTLAFIPRWEYAEHPHYFGDGQYMRALSKRWRFIGIDRVVAYKRDHPFNMLKTRGASRGPRE